MKVTIIGRENNSGLEKDKMLLTALLEEHHINVEFRNVDYYVPPAADSDLCIHLEIINEKYFGKTKTNILIPNQEWFMRDWIMYLDRFDAIFCKSFYAYNIFKCYHSNVKYTGFTSIDCYIECDKTTECFHSSGKSRAKGTTILIDALQTFDRSRLHVVSNYIEPIVNNGNISFYDRLPEEEFNSFRNKFLIHIYPSVIEGFGHCINEAKSCASVVLTTNFPPMNELMSDFLIPIDKEYLLDDRLGGIVSITPSSISKTLEKVLSRDDLHELGANNRKSFLENDLLFRQQFMTAFSAL